MEMKWYQESENDILIEQIPMKTTWSNTFKIAVADPEAFDKKDVITMDNSGNEYEVLKVYKMNWCKHLVSWLHIKRNWFMGLKVKYIKKEDDQSGKGYTATETSFIGHKPPSR